MNPIKIGAEACGIGERVYIAFEVGPTVTDLSSALSLVDVIAMAGGSAVKLQVLDPHRLVGDPALAVTYRDWTGAERRESMREVLQRRFLRDEEWAVVFAHAKARGLGIVATVDYPETLKLAVELGADALKACSGDVNHLDWIAEMARTGLPLMLDTGNATLGEIERAVDTAVAAGNEALILHQCPSGYPARLPSINLRVLTTLQAMFPDFVVAFSDHSLGRDMDVAAVSLAARLIEKTLTLDRTQLGPEHAFSLEPFEAPDFVQAIRDVETALGRSRRVLTDAERAAKVNARRSAFLAKDLRVDDVITRAAIAWRRPGDGIEPDEQAYLVGRRVRHDLPAGHQLEWEDLA